LEKLWVAWKVMCSAVTMAGEWVVGREILGAVSSVSWWALQHWAVEKGELLVGRKETTWDRSKAAVKATQQAV